MAPLMARCRQDTVIAETTASLPHGIRNARRSRIPRDIPMSYETLTLPFERGFARLTAPSPRPRQPVSAAMALTTSRSSTGFWSRTTPSNSAGMSRAS